MVAFFEFLFVCCVLTVDDGGEEKFKKLMLTAKTDLYSEAKARCNQTPHLLSDFQVL